MDCVWTAKESSNSWRRPLVRPGHGAVELHSPLKTGRRGQPRTRTGTGKPGPAAGTSDRWWAGPHKEAGGWAASPAGGPVRPGDARPLHLIHGGASSYSARQWRCSPGPTHRNWPGRRYLRDGAAPGWATPGPATSSRPGGVRPAGSSRAVRPAGSGRAGWRRPASAISRRPGRLARRRAAARPGCWQRLAAAGGRGWPGQPPVWRGPHGRSPELPAAGDGCHRAATAGATGSSGSWPPRPAACRARRDIPGLLQPSDAGRSLARAERLDGRMSYAALAQQAAAGPRAA